jgi:hypothetical protein
MKTQLYPFIAATVVGAIALVGCSELRPSAQSESQTETSAQVSSEPFTYDAYAEVLDLYVDEQGLVDYKALQANRQLLDDFNASIGAVSPATYESWNEAEQIAFLINAYNAFTLESIIDQDPLKDSIRDIPGVWRIRSFKIAGQEKTLDNIEHQTLRSQFNEPRIHAALVCAAISCPPLRPEPYTAENLDAQLDDQVEQWLANADSGFKIDRENNQVYVSSIFDWFGEDWLTSYSVDQGFTGSDKEKAVLNFISDYVDAEDREYLAAGDYNIGLLDYDWSLNIQPE